MAAAHEKSGAVATLAVMDRSTSRYLLFDDHGLLGRVNRIRGEEQRVRQATGEVRPLAFSGIHVIAPDLPGRITEEGTFSILEPYLRLAAKGARILPFRMDGCRWLDVGKPAELALAERWFA
jgi:NDP-sugar pyrophosphorylase family protein